eukprot:675607_1
MSSDYSTGYGVKYITPTLIMKHANIEDQKQLSSITDLDLSFKHSDEHKIQKLEHLERCKSLERLSICSQSLHKMNGIQTLSNLIELDLSGNKISKIECIKQLHVLQKLDLSFNSITAIPGSISYLARLIQLNISRNKLQTIGDVLNLRPCSNLQKLDLNNNPISTLQHYRPYIIYYLSQMSMLDSKAISQSELIESRQRFERNEMETLLNTIHQKEEQITSLKQNMSNLSKYKQQSQQTIEELNQYIEQQKQNITELNTQLTTQQHLIRSKNDALTKTRNELSQMEDQYYELQLSIQHTPHGEREHKEESEELLPMDHDLPSKLSDACAVYLDSIQSVNEIMARYNGLKQEYEVGKENMNMIQQQIAKSNRALHKLNERHNIRQSMENPFENEEYSRILSEPPLACFDMEWNVSPIQKRRHDDEEEKQQHMTVSDDSIKAKIREAHQIEEDIARIEEELKRKRRSTQNTNGNRGSMGTYSSHVDKSHELVQQLTCLVESMDKIEGAFSMKQRLSHSHEFDELRIKLVQLYIKRYKNEQQSVRDTVDRLDHESNNIENQLSDYISNRNALLVDIHRILQQLDTDCIDANAYQFIPKSYTDHLPQSLQQQYQNIVQQLDEHKKQLQKERNVTELLRNQIQQRQDVTHKSGPNSQIVHDLIVRAETAENKIQELSFVKDKFESLKPQKQSTLRHELEAANDKIESLEQMLKQHESELVETLTQKLQQSETECNRLKRETEEKLSFAKYLMTTKEQRLEAEKTINLTLQREIEEMKEQSQIFSTPNQQQYHEMRSYTEPMSMNQSMQRNKRLFDSEPIQSNISKNLLNDDQEPSEHDAVRLNIDDDDDESIHSTHQNIMQLSLRLSNLRSQVQSEEETIKALESKKCDLTQECQQCIEKLNQIQTDISECKDKRQNISSRLDEIELEHKEQKLRQQQVISTEESQQIVQELKKQSEEYANQLEKMETNTKQLMQQKEDAQRQLKEIVHNIEDKQQQYNQITKRIQIKNFELSNLDQSEMNDGNDEEEEEEEEETPTKRQEEDIDGTLQMKRSQLKDIEERLPIVCQELESTLQQLNCIKNELRNHENYHKIIRLDAVETEIEERIKELSRLKDEMQNARNMERRLHEKIAESAQELKGIEYQMDVRSKEINKKISQIESMEKTLNKKQMEAVAMNKNCDKKNRKLMKLNDKLSEAEQLLKDISIEQSNANSKLNSLRHELYSAENELKSSMDLLQRSSQTSDAIKLFRVIEQMETEHRALSTVQTKIQKAHHELKSLQDEIQMHKKHVAELQHETEEAQSNCELQSKQKDAKEHEMNELMSTINDLQRNKRNLVRGLENEESNVRDARAQVDAQKTELRALKKEHHEMDKQLNDKRYKLMSTEHDLSETKDQLNVMKKEYDKMKAKIRPKQQQLDVELYRIYKKDQTEREEKLEHYNKRLIEMDELVNSKKLLLLQHENEMDDMKHRMNESNKRHRVMAEESSKIQREIQINKGKLSIYQKEIETQRRCLDTLYEKKRQKTVDMFKDKSSEIRDANDRLHELQKQMNAVQLELDAKKRILNDIHEEQELLNQETQQRSQLQQELLDVKQKIAQAENELQSKTYEVQNVEKQLNEMIQTMKKMKRDITKRSGELSSDRAIELEALQCQINKARQDIIELNKMNLEKQNKHSALKQSIAHKESTLRLKEDKWTEMQQEMERNNSELGQMDASIQLKRQELTRIKEMIWDYSKRRVNLIRENKQSMKMNVAEIAQELDDKSRLLEEISHCISDREHKLLSIEETIKKRSEDHEKLENGIRQSSFESLRIKSEELAKTCAQIKVKDNELNRIKESLHLYEEQYQSLSKEIQHKESQSDSLEHKLHELKKDLSNKKREFEHVTLQITKDKSQLNQIETDLSQLSPKKESLHQMNNELKEKETEVQQLKIQYENADNELEMMRSNITSSKTQYETLCAEIENLNALREKANDGLRSTQKELQSMNEELERVKLDLELQSDQLYTSKSQRLEAVMNELSTKSRELNDIKKKSRSMADLLLLRAKELKQTTNHIQQEKLSLTHITSEHNDTQRKLKNKRNELRVVTMECQRKSKEEIGTAIESHKAKLNELEEEILEKKKHLEKLHLNTEQYTNDLETLKQENNYYSEQKIGKMGQINDLTMTINAKKQELDKARLEIELKSKQIDEDVSIKMREIMNQIQIKEDELHKLNHDCQQKSIQMQSLNLNMTQNESKLLSLQNQMKEIHAKKLDSSHELEGIKQSIEQYKTRLMDKENKLKDCDQETQLKLQQLHELSGEFDEQTEELRQSRSSLQRVNVDFDTKNNQLQSIVHRINSAKHQLSLTPNMNLSLLSDISSPEQGRANLTAPLDVSLEEINEDKNKSMTQNTTPQIVIRTVEKLRRTIDAMCYPRGGCIFSLSSSINHYTNALDTLEEKRVRLVSILQSDEEEEEHKEKISSEEQSQAVSDLSKIWEELQTVKKVIKKLHLEKQHLETTLHHALNIIQNKSKSPSKSPTKPHHVNVFASASSFASFSTIHSTTQHTVEESVKNVLQSIESQGNVWRNSLNAMDERLKGFETKVDRMNMERNEVEMKHTLSELEVNISHKRQELNGIGEQLSSQRVLLRQLKQQSDAIANKVSSGQVYQLSSSPTMARQIGNKMRLEKQLNDLKQELNEKKQELSLISQQLSDEVKQQQNLLLSSLESDKTHIVSNRIHEIQKLYKLREKNLKKRIDFYKKELQKRDCELNDLQNVLSNTRHTSQKHEQMQNDIVNQMRSLQMERSRAMNRRDLKNQIKERDEQIAFLINHFGGGKASDESFSSSSTSAQALSQIEAKLSSALAPFRKENEENVDETNKQKRMSAYHFVPATSSSDNIKTKKKKRKKRKPQNDSLLKSIFGSDPPIEPQHRAKYQRDTVSSKQKRRKHNTRPKHDESSDDDDDDDVNYNNSSLSIDNHEDRYKSLNRKYG